MSDVVVDADQAKTEVAAFIEKAVNASPLPQKEIAKICGYSTPNIVTMLKQGSTKLAIDKIPRLARALNLDRVEFFKFVVSKYRPEEYEAIIEVFGEPVTEAERRVINLVRELVPAENLVGNTTYYLDKIRAALSH